MTNAIAAGAARHVLVTTTRELTGSASVLDSNSREDSSIHANRWEVQFTLFAMILSLFERTII
jgi:hypothetical protein